MSTPGDQYHARKTDRLVWKGEGFRRGKEKQIPMDVAPNYSLKPPQLPHIPSLKQEHLRIVYR